MNEHPLARACQCSFKVVALLSLWLSLDHWPLAQHSQDGIVRSTSTSYKLQLQVFQGLNEGQVLALARSIHSPTNVGKPHACVLASSMNDGCNFLGLSLLVVGYIVLQIARHPTYSRTGPKTKLFHGGYCLSLILYCTILYCTILYYTILYYTILYYTILCSTLL